MFEQGNNAAPAEVDHPLRLCSTASTSCLPSHCCKPRKSASSAAEPFAWLAQQAQTFTSGAQADRSTPPVTLAKSSMLCLATQKHGWTPRTLKFVPGPNVTAHKTQPQVLSCIAHHPVGPEPWPTPQHRLVMSDLDTTTKERAARTAHNSLHNILEPIKCNEWPTFAIASQTSQAQTSLNMLKQVSTSSNKLKQV